MLLPFNEMSLADVKTPEDIVSFFCLIEELVKLLNLKKLPDIVFKSNILSSDITANSNLYDIINNSSLCIENKGILFSIIQNTPFIEEFDLTDIQIKYNDTYAYGLAYAHLKDIPSISIPNHPWLEFLITAQKEYLTSQAHLEREIVNIKHIGDLNKCNKPSWFTQILPNSYYSNSDEFINFCNKNFLRVQISSDSLNSIKQLPLDKLIKMERSFQILNNYCEEYWKFGNLRSTVICDLGLHLRPDSEITMNKYGEQRDFKNEINETERFTLHFDVSEGERSYIKGLTQEKKIFVAYVGAHLSTKKHPK
ncbi:hypothetical protein ACY2HK_002481 [Providencia rettgeri]